MISVNKVYDTVLRLLNKEERGDITPSEFNRFASLAQRNIFEKTFEEDATLRTGRRFDAKKAKNIREKLEVHKTFGTATSVEVSSADTNTFTLPSGLYRLDSVRYTVGGKTRIASLLPTNKLEYIINSDKELITVTSPKYVRYAPSSTGLETIVLYPSTITSGVGVTYYKVPADPIWGSSSPTGVELYDSTRSTNFVLHPSEEFELIKKILFYAGVSIRETEIVQIAAGDQATDYNTENK